VVNGPTDAWVQSAAARIAARAGAQLEALVAVSSPSGDVEGAEAAVAVATDALPAGATVERLACSSPGHARDLCARVAGEGSGRALLLGHLDTVVAHGAHRGLERDGARLVGSGAIDMKGGVALALGVLRELADRCCSSPTRSGAPARSPTSSASRASTRASASRPASTPPTATTP
jgi:glutamate carboxypeptidase